MGKYKRVRGGFLGQGAHGVVEKYVRISDREVFACKIIRFRAEERHRNPALQEYNIVSKLKHPNIVSYVDIVWKSTAAQIFMSLCGGGSLADFIASRTKSGGSHVSEHYISSVFSQLASALLYCHHGITIQPDGQAIGNFWDWDPIIHRDIKPGNILLSTEVETEHVVVKLGDFGLSTFIDFENAPATYAGTKQYLAPEISRSRQTRNYWTRMCDIFSLGSSIWELGSLATQFSGHMDDDDKYKDLPDIYSAKLNGRIAACMSVSPERRPDASDLLKSLRRYQQEMGFNVESQDVSAENSIRPSTITPSPDHPHVANENWLQDLTKITSQYESPVMLGGIQAQNWKFLGRGTDYQDLLGTGLISASGSLRTSTSSQNPERRSEQSRSPISRLSSRVPNGFVNGPGSSSSSYLLITVWIDQRTGYSTYRKFNIRIDPDCTVQDIKKAIEHKERIRVWNQELSIGAKILDGHVMAREYGIGDESTIKLNGWASERIPQLMGMPGDMPMHFRRKYEVPQEDALTREYKPVLVHHGTKNGAPQDNMLVAGPIEEARPPSKPRVGLQVKPLTGQVLDVHVDSSRSILDIERKLSEAGGWRPRNISTITNLWGQPA